MKKGHLFKPTWYKYDRKADKWNEVSQRVRGSKPAWAQVECKKCDERHDVSWMRIHDFWDHWSEEKLQEFFRTHEPHPNINYEAVMEHRHSLKKRIKQMRSPVQRTYSKWPTTAEWQMIDAEAKRLAGQK